MDTDEKAKKLFDNFWQRLKNLVVQRRIKDVDSWDGSASNYSTAESYCNACLINLNDSDDPEEWTKVACKLPVREEGDSKDTFVRQAVYAATQRLNQTEAPEEALSAAREQLKMAYDEMGEEPPEVLTRAKSLDDLNYQVYEAAWMKYPEAYLHSVYLDSDNGMFAVLSQDGKLYRSPIEMEAGEVMLGDWFEVEQEFVPVQTRTVIRQAEGGRYRWVSQSATSVLNRVGEIDSRALFDSFIEYIEETGEYPIRQFYHQGEQFRTGQADFVARDGNVLITSGLYDEDNILATKEIEALQNEPDYWGESIGYKPLAGELLRSSDDIQIPVYTRGILKEISFLPEKHAANLFTVIHKQEVNRMALKGTVKEVFDKLFGDDSEAAEMFLEGVDETNRAIEEEKLVTRDKKEEAVEDTGEETEEVKEAETETEILVTDDVVEAVVTRLQSMENEEIVNLRTMAKEMAEAVDTANQALENIANQFEDMNTRLKALERKEEDKKRAYLEDVPRKNTVRTVYKPRQQENNKPLTAAEKAEILRNNGTY